MLACFAVATTAAAQPAPDPSALLADAERTLAPAQSHRTDLTITEYKERKAEREMTLRCFVRVAAESSGRDFLSVILEPPMYRYRLLLKHGPDFWLFQPGAKQPFKLAPEHRLLGQVALSDLMVTPGAAATAELLGAEKVTGGDKVAHDTWHLRVTPGASRAPFARAELWLDQALRIPVMARTFAEGGRLLKTAFYTRYQDLLGARRPARIILVDGFNPEQVSCIEVTACAPGDWPERWFLPENLRAPLANLPLPPQKPTGQQPTPPAERP